MTKQQTQPTPEQPIPIELIVAAGGAMGFILWAIFVYAFDLSVMTMTDQSLELHYPIIGLIISIIACSSALMFGTLYYDEKKKNQQKE